MVKAKANEIIDEDIDDVNLSEDIEQNLPAPSVRSAMTVGSSAGEIDLTDFKIPYLQVAYGVGNLSVKFNPGDLVLGKEHLLAHKNDKLTLIILSSVKYYKEVVGKQEWDNGVRPRQFLSREEVIANKGTLDWVNGPDGERIRPTFGPAMDLKVLIKKPENVDSGIFGLEFGGEMYTPAYFSVDKSAYQRVGKPVLTACLVSLKGVGILGGVWELWTETQAINKHNTVVPMLRLSGRTTAEVRDEITATLS